MKYKLIAFFVILALCACSWSDSHSYYFDEMENEVMLSDLYGLDFNMVCGFAEKTEKCGLVFLGFSPKSESGSCTPNSCSYSTTLVGFKDASILSLQVENEATGKIRPLISYFQEDSVYIKGNVNPPSAMNLNARKESAREISLNGFYDGKDWIAHDTTIAIGDTLFPNSDGKLKFSVIDSEKNRARLAIDFSGILKNYDKKNVVKCDLSALDKDVDACLSVKASDYSIEYVNPEFLNGDSRKSSFIRVLDVMGSSIENKIVDKIVEVVIYE